MLFLNKHDMQIFLTGSRMALSIGAHNDLKRTPREKIYFLTYILYRSAQPNITYLSSIESKTGKVRKSSRLSHKYFVYWYFEVIWANKERAKVRHGCGWAGLLNRTGLDGVWFLNLKFLNSSILIA